ncbi:MAG: hypothetical protein K1X94_30000 [Sandaracinaceae bacterium]|nr:hypothetical protein [Sandaracinaceae bacterium]
MSQSARDSSTPADASSERHDAASTPALDAASPALDAATPDAASAPDAYEPPTGPCTPLVLDARAPFTPTESEPFRRTDLDIDDGLVFGRIEVELSFVRGPWASAHPDGSLGMHNLFWVHRGTRGQDWLDNSVGYLNFTATTQLRLETNLGITDESIWSDVLSGSGCRTDEGASYHVHYVYDAEHHHWWFELTDAAGESICGREGVPLLDRIDGTSTGRRPASAFFIEIGHEIWSPGHDGPEVATLDWTYRDAEVRFYPLGCPP